MRSSRITVLETEINSAHTHNGAINGHGKGAKDVSLHGHEQGEPSSSSNRDSHHRPALNMSPEDLEKVPAVRCPCAVSISVVYVLFFPCPCALCLFPFVFCALCRLVTSPSSRAPPYCFTSSPPLPLSPYIILKMLRDFDQLDQEAADLRRRLGEAEATSDWLDRIHQLEQIRYPNCLPSPMSLPACLSSRSCFRSCLHALSALYFLPLESVGLDFPHFTA